MERIPYRIETSRAGTPTLIVESTPRETPLHSKIDPLREGSLTGNIDPARHDFLVVLGCGLGYGLVELAPNVDIFSRIIIIERLEGIRDAVKNNPSTSFLAVHPGITIIEGRDPQSVQEILAEEMQLEGIRGVRVIEHPQSIRLFPEYYGAIRDSITRLLERKAGSASARRAFRSRYLRNGLLNFRRLDRFRPVSDLFDTFGSMDAVVVTSGPGLEESLDLLREKQKDVLVIAADSALPVLSCTGIHADYVLAVDPQAYITEHLYGLPAPHPDLVISLTCHAGIPGLPAWNNPGTGLYLSLNSHPLCQILDELFPAVTGNLDSRTGNVAGDAVLLALRMNVRRAALVGFDFSFPGQRIYSRSTAYQRRYSSILNNRFYPAETSNMGYIRQGGTLREDGVLTRRSFLQYRGSLHDMVMREGAERLFHVRYRGLAVPGISAINLDDFLRDSKASCEKDDARRKIREAGGTLGARISLARFRDFLLRDDVFMALLDESLGETRRNYRDAMYKEMIRGLVEE